MNAAELPGLHAPFPADEIEWRVGSTTGDKSKGMALAYLTARHIMDRLDDVCGAANWQDRYEFHGARTICYLSLRIDGEWVTKADGAGDSDVEAEKGAISDALKRAAVKWGIGRYLYEAAAIWVEIEQAGKSYKIKADQYSKLTKSLEKQFGGPPAARQADPPAAPNEGALKTLFDKHEAALKAAATPDALRIAWDAAKADAGPLSSDQKALLNGARRATAARLAPVPAKNLGEHLDRMDEAEKVGQLQ